MTRRRGVRLPGDRLRSLASRVCSAAAMTGLIDPVVADLQSEYADAIHQGRVWRGRWLRFIGYIAFWKVIGLHAASRAWPVAREWAAADDRALGRTLVFSCIAIGIVMMLLMVLPLSFLTHRADDGRVYLRLTADQVGWLLLYIVPQAIPIAVPIGFATGIVCGLHGRVATLRTKRSIIIISVVFCALMLVTLAWIMSAANQAFRELIAGRPLPRGPNDLTLGELRGDPHRFQYHQRWAISFVPLALGPFALGLSIRMRGRFRAIVMGVVALVVYLFLVFVFFSIAYPAPAQTAWPPPFLAAWTPNIIFMTAAVALMRNRVHI